METDNNGTRQASSKHKGGGQLGEGRTSEFPNHQGGRFASAAAPGFADDPLRLKS